MKLISYFNKFFLFKLSGNQKKFVYLNVAQFFSLAIGLINSVIIARMLGAIEYGLFALIFSVIGFLVIFFRFGFFSSISVVLANEKDKRKIREIIGIGHLIAIIIGFSFALLIFLISFIINNIFKENIGHILILLTPFLILLPASMYINAVCIGTGKIEYLAFDLISKSFLYFFSLLILLYYDSLNVISVSLAQVGVYSLVTVFIFFMMKPLFYNLKENFLLIWEKNKIYGFHLYTGQLANQTSYRSDEIMIPLFANSIELGFYKIASSFTSTLVIPIKNLAQIKYKSYANLRKIELEIFVGVIFILIFEIILLILFIEPVVETVYGKEYSDVYKLSLFLIPVIFFNGIIQLHNAFMSVNAFGKIMRNNSFSMTGINLGGNFILIPLFGAIGAAISSGLSIATYALLTLYFYHKITKLN